MQSRIIWMDALRGFLILLVITQHWTSFIPTIYQDEFWYNLILNIKQLFAPFRMELLFFLSGLLVNKGLKKTNMKYFNGKSQNLLYPYIIWSLAYLAINTYSSLLNGEYANITNYFLRILFGTTDITWFLFFLLIYYVVIKFLRNINVYLIVLICVSASTILRQFNLPFFLDVGFTSLDDFFYYFIYFFLADYLIKNEYNIEKICKSKLILALSIFSFIATTYINFSYNIQKTHLAFLLFVLVSIPILIFSMNITCKAFPRLGFFLSHFGKNSIFYYLMHMIIFIISNKFLGFLNIPPILICMIILFLALIIPYITIQLNSKIKWINFFFSSKNITTINNIKSKIFNI